MTKPIYAVSESGSCPRALSAIRLGYEPVKHTEANLAAMKEGTRHERWVAEDIAEECGVKVLSAGRCMICANERYGFHVSIDTPLFELVGHIDRRIEIDGYEGIGYPLEIKALGRFTFDKFKKQLFSGFPDYEAQETCYLRAAQLPGYYAVKNRDTGELLRFRVGRNGTSSPKIPTFDKQIELSNTLFDDIIDNLNRVEAAVQAGELVTVPFDEKSEHCRYCRVRYLCIDEKELGEIKQENLPTLLEAAGQWREGKDLERQAEDRLEQAKNIFVTHAKSTNTPKYSVGGVSVSYSGERSRQYIDEKRLKELVSEDILKQVYKSGKVWEDIRIRVLQ